MRKIILGTDWWSDCDDAVAVRLLTRAHKAGEIELIGVAINACMEYSAASLDGFLTLDRCKNIPVGIDLGATGFAGKTVYQKRLVPFASKYKSNADAESALKLYRRLLAESESKVEIIEIGFLQVFAELLMSKPDEISDKSGLELVREKVSRVWAMAGKWDADGESEHNFNLNERTISGGKIFLEKCPVTITFLGWEVSFDIKTGGELPHSDHLWQVLSDHGSAAGRSSWDPMLTLLALTGDAESAGYREVRGTASLDDEGRNYFVENEGGMHSYVVKTKENDFYRYTINSLL